MKRSKSGLLSSFLEDETSINSEEVEILVNTLEKSLNIVVNQNDDPKYIIKKNSEELNSIIIEENIRYFEYVKEISIR